MGGVLLSVILDDSLSEGNLVTNSDGTYGGSVVDLNVGSHSLTSTFSGNSAETAPSTTAIIVVTSGMGIGITMDATSTTVSISPAVPTSGQVIAFSGLVMDTVTGTGLSSVPVSVVTRFDFGRDYHYLGRWQLWWLADGCKCWQPHVKIGILGKYDRKELNTSYSFTVTSGMMNSGMMMSSGMSGMHTSSTTTALVVGGLAAAAVAGYLLLA